MMSWAWPEDMAHNISVNISVNLLMLLDTDVPGILMCFESFNLIHPLPGWSDPSLCPDGYLVTVPLDDSRLLCSYDAGHAEGSGQRSSGKALTSNLYWQASRPPAGPLVVADQTFVLGKLSFTGLLQTVSSSRTTCLVDADSRTTSGLKVVLPEAREIHLLL